jgi:hypothetical protein
MTFSEILGLILISVFVIIIVFWFVIEWVWCLTNNPGGDWRSGSDWRLGRDWRFEQERRKTQHPILFSCRRKKQRREDNSLNQ